ncbi:superfamily II DNA/RNA helicase [Parvibaculum indicum]|uniref:DEAD/DEAH box helicase n=1 Tax=Parvibaculum indicum TaxID=562969 RepID=UPI00141FAD83|nr:DEAD/DEAH box helicase [Parvibaculum indicum]NIJ42649.1 superfamily II DNA/RNA helicase [Parvibaculum indicum]
MTFDELGLTPEVLKAVAETGYTEPTPIQAQAIPHVLAGKDVLGIAQTGTGKTASFTLPMIDKLSRGRAKARMPRSLILEPTRELAAQVAENFEKYGKYHKLSMALLIGGVSFGDQEKKLDRGVDVLIATPGRLLDHCQRGKVLLTGVQVLVIDEADRMLDMGFIPDIEEICRKIPFTRQTLLFSATMPPEIQRLTENFQHAPERVEVARASSANERIKQAQVKISRRDQKRDALRHIIDTENVKNAIIFCNRKRDVSVLHRSLDKHGYSTGAIHGDLDQSTRMKTLEGFRSGEIRLLVASDVAARGLDIPDVSHVFNFDPPTHAEDYVHRIGRTGRAGKEGAAFTLVTPEDRKYIEAIEKMLDTTIPVHEIGADKEDTDSKAEAEASAPETGEEETEPKSRRRGGRSRKKKTDEAQPAAEASAPEEAEAEKPEPAAEEKPRRTRGGRNRRRDRDDDDDKIVGMGDHVPAFMLREVKLPRRRSTDEEDASAEKETEEA